MLPIAIGHSGPDAGNTVTASGQSVNDVRPVQRSPSLAHVISGALRPGFCDPAGNVTVRATVRSRGAEGAVGPGGIAQRNSSSWAT